MVPQTLYLQGLAAIEGVNGRRNLPHGADSLLGFSKRLRTLLTLAASEGSGHGRQSVSPIKVIIRR